MFSARIQSATIRSSGAAKTLWSPPSINISSLWDWWLFRKNLVWNHPASISEYGLYSPPRLANHFCDSARQSTRHYQISDSTNGRRRSGESIYSSRRKAGQRRRYPMDESRRAVSQSPVADNQPLQLVLLRFALCEPDKDQDWL